MGEGNKNISIIVREPDYYQGRLTALLVGGATFQGTLLHAKVFLKLYNIIEISYKIVNVPKYFFLSSFSVIAKSPNYL